MKQLLHKILTGNLNKSRVVLSGLGYVLGMVIVLLSLNVYLQFQDLLSKKKSANFLMVGKKVEDISFSGKPFTENEISELRDQEFVVRAAPIQANQFGIWINLDVIKLHTQAFAEAVPDQFIDCELPLSWRKYSRRWDEDSEFVPIIISREMINLYNFSFALSNGTPQITDNIIYSLKGEAIIKGYGKKRRFKIAVVGLSERINSVLVPQTFLHWANEEFAPDKKEEAFKLLVEVDNRTDPKIQDFFSDRAYQVEESKLINQKNLSILYVLLFVLIVFGVVFIVFSMVIVVSNFALLIVESKGEIALLRTLGYTYKTIFKHYLKKIVRNNLLGTIQAFVAMYALAIGVSYFLEAIGFEVETGVMWQVWPVGVAIFIVTLYASYLSLKSTLNKA